MTAILIPKFGSLKNWVLEFICYLIFGACFFHTHTGIFYLKTTRIMQVQIS